MYQHSISIHSLPTCLFCGNVSAQYKQVGNAVPVNLAYDIAKEIVHSLDILEANTKIKEAI